MWFALAVVLILSRVNACDGEQRVRDRDRAQRHFSVYRIVQWVCMYGVHVSLLRRARLRDGLRWALVLIVETPWTRNGAIASGRGRITDIISGSFGLETTKKD